jgi:hypothetical protein
VTLARSRLMADPGRDGLAPATAERDEAMVGTIAARLVVL